MYVCEPEMNVNDYIYKNAIFVVKCEDLNPRMWNLKKGTENKNEPGEHNKKGRCNWLIFFGRESSTGM